ncbi:class I SAM-dependent methyltransferase [Cetobacterium sp.]|uniref:class I SAM-dependent methyltransferase n=1 Tax=Cetobacterium sp. TaxID=2071632 RepID=UPI003F33A6F4
MINKNRGYKKNTIEFFNKIAERNHGDSYKHYKTVLSWIDPKKIEKILDLGCGKGELLKEIKVKFSYLENKKQFQLFGVDISYKMIEKAKLGNNGIEFKIGDSEKLEFQDNFFEVITCLNSFHHYENPQKSLEEMYRVLSPGGNLVLGEIYILEILRWFVNKTLPYGNTGDFRIYSSKEIKNIFNKAGFVFLKEKFIFPSLKVYLFTKSN